MIQRKCRAQVRIGQQDSRGCMTHVALATNLLGLQAFLPQIFICNKRRLTRALERRLHSSVPQNVILLREDSSWNTSRHMVWLMALLGNLFRTRFPRHQPIIILDTAPCHITPQVIREARLQGLFLLPVPAGLTPLLQPLDLWCFAPYKRLLEDESRKQRMDQGGEPLSVETWFKCIFQVCTDFWAGRSFWKAFAQAGLPTCDRTHPLHRDLRVLFPNGRPDVEEQCLSQEEFRQLLPRNYNLHRTFDDFMGGPRGEVPQLL